MYVHAYCVTYFDFIQLRLLAMVSVMIAQAPSNPAHAACAAHCAPLKQKAAAACSYAHCVRVLHIAKAVYLLCEAPNH